MLENEVDAARQGTAITKTILLKTKAHSCLSTFQDFFLSNSLLQMRSQIADISGIKIQGVTNYCRYVFFLASFSYGMKFRCGQVTIHGLGQAGVHVDLKLKAVQLQALKLCSIP